MAEVSVDLLVIGGGVAGLAAAEEAARAGRRVLLCDECHVLGGRAPARARDLSALGVDVRLEAPVVDVAANGRAIAGGSAGFSQIQACAIVLAAGARTEGVLFDGWMHPGVVTADALRTAMLGSGIVGGRRIVVVGWNEDAFSTAREAMAAGAADVTLVTADHPDERHDTKPAAFDGAACQRLHLLPEWTIERAEGLDGLERAALVRRDGSERRTLACDIIVVATRRAPALEAAQLAGARFVYAGALGGWVPVHDRTLETTVDRLFVAGGAAGADGEAIEELTGRIAVCAALARTDGIDRSAAIDALWNEVEGVSTPERMAARRFVWRARSDATLVTEGNAWSRNGVSVGSERAPVMRAGARRVEPWTVICPCEDVTLAEVEESVAQGARSPDDIKRLTRCGMGACQWRTCRPMVAAEMSRVLDVPLDAIPLPNVRFPLRPIPLGDIAAAASSQESGAVRSVLSEVE